MSKTISIRIDEDNYEFLSSLSKDEKAGLSRAVRELVHKGRLMLAVERYKNGEASLGKASELAGLPIGRMMTVLQEYGVQSNLEEDDYIDGLVTLRKVW